MLKTYSRHQYRVLLTLIFSFLFWPMGANAACSIAGEKGMLYNYEGDINGRYRIRLSLEVDTDLIRGVYIYHSTLKDIPIKAQSINENSIQFEEFDANGLTSARFDGAFQTTDPRGKFNGSSLNCEVITGDWFGLKNPTRRLPFYLSLESITGGTLDHRYAIAGAPNDDIVQSGALKFWNGLKNNDRRAVAACFHYPLSHGLVRGKTLQIKSAEDFVANFDDIFPKQRIQKILGYFPRHMFANYQGIMLGNGEVWFSSDGKVIKH